MFGFNVLTWNASYGGGNYSKSLNRVLFGGSPGHSSAELIIPITPENKKLLDEVNNNGEGNLKVKETTTLVSRPTDSEPFYEMVQVPSYKIYFSFWGDLSTKKTAEGHRMLDYIRDSIEEGKGIPVQYSQRGIEILGNRPQEWHGLIGSTKGHEGIEYVQNLTGLSEEQVQASKEKMKQLRSIEHNKEVVLFHVKEISQGLKDLKTEEEKQVYLQSERVKEILEMEELATFDELKLRLSTMSSTMEQLREELVDLGVSFGSPPDEIVSFPFDPYQQSSEFGLDYQAILREMGKIANSRVPYHAVSMNCCTTALQVVRAGISPDLEARLKKSGHSLPSSNLLFETPQSVYDYSLTLNSILFSANHNLVDDGPNFGARFSAWLNDAHVRLTATLFPPSEKSMMLNQRAKNKDYLSKTMEGLKLLESEHKKGTIGEESYQGLKKNAVELIDLYRGKIKENDQQLLAKGYISRTNNHEEQIQAGLATLPYAQKENILKLDSDAKIIELIDKISSDIYSNMEEPEIYGAISSREVTKLVAAHVEGIVNLHRIQVERFEYESAKSITKTQNIAHQIKGILEKEHKGEKISVDAALGEIFLSRYESNRDVLLKNIPLFESRAQNPNKKMGAVFEQKLIQAKKALEEHEEAIQAIKSAQESGNLAQKIDIIFPPSSRPLNPSPSIRLGDLSLTEIENFSSHLKSNPQAAGAIGQTLYKNLNIVNKLQEILIRDLKQITPNYYDFEQIEKTRSNFPSGIMGKQSAEDYISHLAQNLISQLDSQEIRPPLPTGTRDAVVTIINFHKYLEENGEKVSNKDEVLGILNAYSLEELKEVLEDTDTINRLSEREQQSIQPSLISKHLTKEDHRFIHLFDKIVTHKREASHQEKHELSILLEKSIGNLDLNKRIGLFEKEKHPLLDKYSLSIPDMKYFMFKTALTELNDSLLAKAEKAMKAIEEGKPLAAKDQLTLYELGRLDDLSKMHRVLEGFDQQGLVEPSSKLKKLYEQAGHSIEIMKAINGKVADEHLLENGDLVMNHSKKSLALKNKQADREVALTQTFISQYGHAAQVFIEPESGEPKFSHVWGEHQIDKVKVVDIAISDTFRVDPIKLIPPDMLARLKEHYGEATYEEEIRKLYKNNVQQLLVESQERFSGVMNDKTARFQAGWADYGVYGGHKESETPDRSKVHGEMYGKEGFAIKDKMICSEFVAKSVVASIYETNEQLKQILLDANKISSEELNGKNVMRVPMERERLERVHPERLIKLLQAEGCLDAVPKSAFLSKLVNQADPYLKPDLKSVRSPGMIFYEQLVNLARTNPVKEEFVQKAVEACRVYSEDEALGVDIDTPRMQSFLTENFGKVHDEVKSEPKGVFRTIANFFTSLAEFFGYKKESKAIVEKTIGEIEKVHAEALKDGRTLDHDNDLEKEVDDEIDEVVIEEPEVVIDSSDKFKVMKANVQSLTGRQSHEVTEEEQQVVDKFKQFKAEAQSTIKGDDAVINPIQNIT